jgi:hypothetical protein
MPAASVVHKALRDASSLVPNLWFTFTHDASIASGHALANLDATKPVNPRNARVIHNRTLYLATEYALLKSGYRAREHYT